MKLADTGSMVNEELFRGLEEVCPECGCSMVESDRQMEDGAVFIWYTCTREDCTGRSMAKKAPRMCAI